MSNQDVRGESGMWAEVFSTAIREHRNKVTAAKKLKRSIMMNGHQEIIGSVEQELQYARMYFTSPDAALIADYAGIEINLPAIMALIDTPCGNPFSREYSAGATKAAENRKALAPKIKEMREKGMTVRDISDALKMSQRTLYRITEEASA